jgi:potassium efflux system protein
LLVLMVVLLFKVHMIHRSGRLGEGRGGSNSWLSRYRKAIYAVSMLAPLAIAVLISFGYEYMTFAVMSRLEWTLLALIVITVLQAIATRALLVRRRRLTIEQYRQRRASQGESELVDTVGIDLASPEVDLGSVSHQAQQLVRLLTMSAVIASLALIWDDLLPGLRMLDRVTLWSTGTTTVNPVTLRDLLFALLSIAVTVYAAKSLPALIEMFFLQPLSPGARYAVSTIFRYVIGALGFVFGLSFLSIPWSQLSWIVAAASVGLGFGLQEILANFVSGIILLLEQPIRVGDIVTVDGSTGVVSKMQIRATTVTNWDRQELVIPNKDLVTGKLLNWTLSNVINRVVINVGVAYGSDANQVRDILGGVVCGHPEVLEDPAPLVTFEQFGDSSLNFVVRCYLPSLEKRLSTVHELHTGIADALKAAGIEIPFPQRDIHMTIEPSGTAIDGSDRALGRVAP